MKINNTEIIGPNFEIQGLDFFTSILPLKTYSSIDIYVHSS